MIKPICIQDIPEKNRKCIEICNDIEDFLASTDSVAEVVVPDDRTPESVCASYKIAAGRNNYAVKIIQRNKRVFLMRKDCKNES